MAYGTLVGVRDSMNTRDLKDTEKLAAKWERLGVAGYFHVSIAL